MRYRSARATLATFICAASATILASCASDVTAPTGPDSRIASLTLTADSSVVAVGHALRFLLTARDSAGEAMTPSTVSWTSLTPDIASVSPSGAVDGISTGSAVIEARVAGLSAHADLTVVPGMDHASYDFNDGTIGPYINQADTDLDFIPDPTGSGRGDVARFHYKGALGDANRSLEFRYPRRWSQPLYFKGEFYVPVSDLGANAIIRKLIYWQPHKDYEKYSTDGGLATGRTVVVLEGSDLIVDATYNPAATTGKSSDDVRTVATLASGMKGNTWYTLEVYQQTESAVGRADGVLTVWLDGQQVFNRTTMTWSDPAWIGSLDHGVPFDASDIYFERFEVGDQVDWNKGSFDEYRYWDNVQFSTGPLSR